MNGLGTVKRILYTCAAVCVLVLVFALFSLKAYAAPGSVGAWQTGNVVPDNLAWTSAAAYNGYVYVVAGANDTIYTDTVYVAKLNANGSVGTWSTTTPAPYTSSSASVVAYNGYLYYIGGFDGVVINAGVSYAPINADGTLGAWASATNTFPNAWAGASVIVNDNYIYLLGGNTGISPDDSVTYAPINANGSIGSWTATTSLPDTLTAGAAVVHNGRVYFAGGNDGSARTDGVYYATFNPNGTLGTWQTTTALPEEREGAGLVEYNGYLFSIGGYNATNIVDTVYAAPINTNGSVGAWSTTASLPDARTVSGVATYNGFVYNLAGLNTSSAPRNTTYYASLAGYTPPTMPAVSATAVSGVSTTIDVLKDVTDNPDATTLTVMSGPTHGVANVASGKIVYTSITGYVGAESLTYRVCSVNDRSVCSQATLSINVVSGVPDTGYAPTLTQRLSPIIFGAMVAVGLIGVAYSFRIRHIVRK